MLLQSPVFILCDYGEQCHIQDSPQHIKILEVFCWEVLGSPALLFLNGGGGHDTLAWYMYLILWILSTVALPIWSKQLDHVLLFKEVRLSSWTHSAAGISLRVLDLLCIFTYSLRCCKGQLLCLHSSSKVFWEYHIYFAVFLDGHIPVDVCFCWFFVVVFLGLCSIRKRQLWVGFSWHCGFLQFVLGCFLSNCMKCDQSMLLHCKCCFPGKNKLYSGLRVCVFKIKLYGSDLLASFSKTCISVLY